MTTNNIQFKFCKSINDHFDWYTGEIELSNIYCDGFKGSNIFLNDSFYQIIQDSFFQKINNDFSISIFSCYIFLAIDYNGAKVENYYKVWKQIARKWEIKDFIPLQEEIYKSAKYDNFTGLASFKKADLKTALSICDRYSTNCFILLDTNIDTKITLDVKNLAHLFLVKDESGGFNNLFKEYCKEGIFVVRIGDGGEDWEIDFVFDQNSFGKKYFQ